MLSYIYDSISSDVGNDADIADITIKSSTEVSICLLTYLLEEQKLNNSNTVNKILITKTNSNETTYYCGMLVNYGFPLYIQHLTSTRLSLMQNASDFQNRENEMMMVCQ